MISLRPDIDLNQPDSAFRRPLHAAVAADDVYVWQGVVESELGYERYAPKKYLKSEESTAKQNWIETVKLLMDNPKIELNHRIGGWALYMLPLYLATHDMHDWAAEVAEYVSKHPKITANREEVLKAVHMCYDYDRADLMSLFLSGGGEERNTVDLNSLQASNYTIFGTCVDFGRENCVKWFLSQEDLDPEFLGAWTDESKTCTPLTLLLESTLVKNDDKFRLFEYMVNHPRIDVYETTEQELIGERNALHYACQLADKRFATLLLAKGIDLNLVNHNEMNHTDSVALHISMEANHMAVSRALLSHPDLDLRPNDLQRNFLGMAVVNGRPDQVRLLLSAGVNPNLLQVGAVINSNKIPLFLTLRNLCIFQDQYGFQGTPSDINVLSYRENPVRASVRARIAIAYVLHSAGGRYSGGDMGQEDNGEDLHIMRCVPLQWNNGCVKSNKCIT